MKQDKFCPFILSLIYLSICLLLVVLLSFLSPSLIHSSPPPSLLLPYFLLLCFCSGAVKNWGWASGGCSVLSEFGSLHLEFQYLTYLTGNPLYLNKVSAS